MGSFIFVTIKKIPFSHQTLLKSVISCEAVDYDCDDERPR